MTRVDRRLQRVVGQQPGQRCDYNLPARLGAAAGSTSRLEPATAARTTPAGLAPSEPPRQRHCPKTTLRPRLDTSTTAAVATVRARDPSCLSGQRPGSPAVPRLLPAGGAPPEPSRPVDAATTCEYATPCGAPPAAITNAARRRRVQPDVSQRDLQTSQSVSEASIGHQRAGDADARQSGDGSTETCPDRNLSYAASEAPFGNPVATEAQRNDNHRRNDREIRESECPVWITLALSRGRRATSSPQQCCAATAGSSALLASGLVNAAIPT